MVPPTPFAYSPVHVSERVEGGTNSNKEASLEEPIQKNTLTKNERQRKNSDTAAINVVGFCVIRDFVMVKLLQLKNVLETIFEMIM